MKNIKNYLIFLFGIIFMAGCASQITPQNNSSSSAGSTIVLPVVISTVPANAASGVAINGNIIATFSKIMDPMTINSNTFTIKQGTNNVPGVVTYLGNLATFNPVINLATNTVYTATVTIGAKDLSGNTLAANKTWSFITGLTSDTNAPIIISTIPADVSTNIAINANVTATFNKSIDPATINTNTFILMHGTTNIPGVVTYAGTFATFNPTSALSHNTTYTATITTNVKDLANNALVSNNTWTFTTGTNIAKGPAPVNLLTAGNYVILAKSGIDTIPTSAITGDIGVSPAAASYITGFSLIMDGAGTFSTSSQIIGRAFAADYTSPTPSNLTTAVNDMQTAYVDAAGRPTPDFSELGAGDISGLTLVPGLYKWGTGVLISTDITLSGGPNDVWIFQISGDLTLASGVIVHLTGGAQAKNVFWQCFGVAALNTTAHFEGILLAQTSITLSTGASVNGRLYAQTAVSLASSIVTKP